MATTRRTLATEEHARALAAGGPLAEMAAQGAQADRLKAMSIAVVEVDGQIVAYWVAWYALHVEPLWIHADHRKSKQVVEGILAEMQDIVLATGEPVAYAEISDENIEMLEGAAGRLGFQRAPGTLFYTLVDQPALVEG